MHRQCILFVVLPLALWLASCASDVGDRQDPLSKCGLPPDYDIVQVPPDPCLQRDLEFGKTFIAALDATNIAKGPCHETSFAVVGDDMADRVFHDHEVLSITIQYDAPGCTEARLTFGGFHLNGSPWAKHWCADRGCNFGGISSNIFAEPVALGEPSGTITFRARPGAFPPIDVGSPPNLEGFQLCAIVVGFNDGQPDGSRTSDQFNLDSDACAGRP